MTSLESLVPPLDLCKRIPVKTFFDCALAWINIGDITTSNWIVVPNNYGLIYALGGHHTTSAPTLDEVLREMARYPHKYNNAGLEVDGDAFIVGAWLPNRGKPGAHLTEYRDQNGAAAALKLWLELNAKKEEK